MAQSPWRILKKKKKNRCLILKHRAMNIQRLTSFFLLLNLLSTVYMSLELERLRALVVQRVKRCPADLVVLDYLPAGGTINKIPLRTTFNYHLPIVLIWLKYFCKGRKILQVIHSCIKTNNGKNVNLYSITQRHDL